MEVGFGLPNIGPLATREAMFALVDRAEEAGLDSVWMGDHLVFPHNPSAVYPYSRGRPRPFIAESPVMDPLALMAAIAGRTRRVRIGVGVLVLPYRHPLATAKLVSSIHELSDGRVILGVGVGWLPEEFEAAGASFKDRGAVTDEQIRYFRAVWYGEPPAFEGRFYRFKDMTFLPRPRTKIPIWVGGQTTPALRRAARLGDGINLLDLTPEELEQTLAELKRACNDIGRPMEELELSARFHYRLTDNPLEPAERKHPMMGSAEQLRADLEHAASLGLTHITLSPRGAGDLETYLGHVETVATVLAPMLRGRS